MKLYIFLYNLKLENIILDLDPDQDTVLLQDPKIIKKIMIKIVMINIIMIINIKAKGMITEVAINEDILKKMDIIIKNIIKKDNTKTNIQDPDQNLDLTKMKNILKNFKNI